MDPDGRKVDIQHSRPCCCWIDGDAIYVVWPCKRIGHHVTKRRIAQLVYALKKRNVDKPGG